MLHGPSSFGRDTADRANALLTTFYNDHSSYYTSKNNFVLHLHSHYIDMYKRHGSLCNINTFHLEDIIGAVSRYKHGSRFWGEQIVFHLNVSFYVEIGFF
jgi:hypothetical protein